MLCLALQRSSGSCGTQVDADAGGSVNDTQGDVGVGPLSTGEPVDEAPENDKRRTMKTVREFSVRTLSQAAALRPGGPGRQRREEHWGPSRELPRCSPQNSTRRRRRQHPSRPRGEAGAW